jgi:hypothetical protein
MKCWLRARIGVTPVLRMSGQAISALMPGAIPIIAQMFYLQREEFHFLQSPYGLFNGISIISNLTTFFDQT